MTMEQQIVIGKIVAPHGVRGAFSIKTLTQPPHPNSNKKI